MGTFKIINQSKSTDSGLLRRLSAEPGDSLSLYYSFGFDLRVRPETKVHFVLQEQDRDLVIRPPGADLMNTSGFVNPYLGEGLLPGTYSIYAYDEFYNEATSVITLTITAPATTCLKEGEFNFPYLGKNCCPGLETGYDFKCKPAVATGRGIQAAIDYFVRAYGTQVPSCNQWDYIHANVTAAVNAVGGVTWSQGGVGSVEDALRLKYPNVVCSSPPGTLPPGGIQRKCIDANTIAVWNQVTGTYDTAPCSTGKVCKDGYCVDSIAQPPPSGGTNMLKINTQKNLIGTVTLLPEGYWMWKITSPVVKSFGYGGKDSIPATWIDEQGNEQAAVVQKGGWGSGKLDVALDRGGSGALAEEYKSLSEVDIISQIPGNTIQLRYPKSGGLMQWALGLGFIGVAVAYILKKRKG